MSQQFIHIPPNAKVVARHGAKSLLGLRDGSTIFVDEATGTVRSGDDHDMMAMTKFSGDHNSEWADERLVAFARSKKSLATTTTISTKAEQKPRKSGGRKKDPTDISQFVGMLPDNFRQWASKWEPGDSLPLLPPGYEGMELCNGLRNEQNVRDNMPGSVSEAVDSMLEMARMPLRAPMDAQKQLEQAYEKGLLGRAIREVSPNMSSLVARARGLWIDSLNKIRCGPGSAAANRFTDIFGSNCNIPPSPKEIAEGVSGVAREARGAAGGVTGAVRETTGDVRATARRAEMIVPVSTAESGILGLDDDVRIREGAGYSPIGNMAGVVFPNGVLTLRGLKDRKERTAKYKKAGRARRSKNRDFLNSGRARGLKDEEILDEKMRELGMDASVGAFGEAYLHDVREFDLNFVAQSGGVLRRERQPISETILGNILRKVADRAMPGASEESKRRWLESERRITLDGLRFSRTNAKDMVILDLLDQLDGFAENYQGHEMLLRNVPIGVYVTGSPNRVNNPAADPLMQVSINGVMNPAFTLSPSELGELSRGEIEPTLGFGFAGPARQSSGYTLVGKPMHVLLEKAAKDVENRDVPTMPVHIMVGIRDDYLGPLRKDTARAFMRSVGDYHLAITPDTDAFIEATLIHEPEHAQDFLRKMGVLLGYADGQEWAERLRRQFVFDSQTGEMIDVADGKMDANGVVEGPVNLWLDARGGSYLRSVLDATFAPIFGDPDQGRIPANIVKLTDDQKALRLFMFYMKHINYGAEMREHFIRYMSSKGFSRKTMAAMFSEVENDLRNRGFENGTINVFTDVLDNVIGEWSETEQDWVPSDRIMPFVGGPDVVQPLPRGMRPVSRKERQALLDFTGSTYAATNDIELMAELGSRISEPNVMQDIDDFVEDPIRNTQKITKKEMIDVLARNVGMDRVERMMGRDPKRRTSASPQSVGSRAGSTFIPRAEPTDMAQEARPALPMRATGTGGPGPSAPTPPTTPSPATGSRPPTSTFVAPKPSTGGPATFDQTRQVVARPRTSRQGRPIVPMEQREPMRPQIAMRPRQQELPSGEVVAGARTQRPRIEILRNPDGTPSEDPFTGEPQVTVVYPGGQRVRRPSGRRESERNANRFNARGTAPQGVPKTQQVGNNVFRYTDSEEREVIDLDPNRPDPSRPVRISENQFADPVYGLIFEEPPGSEFTAEPFDPTTAPRRRRLDPETGELVDVNPPSQPEAIQEVAEQAPQLDRQNMATAMREAKMQATDQSLVDWFTFNVENWADLLTDDTNERQRIAERLRRDLAMLGYDMANFATMASSNPAFINNYVLSALVNQIRSWKSGAGGRTDEEVARIMGIPLWLVQAATDLRE